MFFLFDDEMESLEKISLGMHLIPLICADSVKEHGRLPQECDGVSRPI